MSFSHGLLGAGCPHCGSTNTRRLGNCTVCHHAVCEHCGSIQMSGGERKPMHRECLRKSGGDFKMIRIVK